MQSIPVGATGSFSLVVMPDHLASRFKDVTLPRSWRRRTIPTARRYPRWRCEPPFSDFV
jgi:hypothetical protein